MAPLIFSNAEVVRFIIVLLRLSGIMIFAPFFSNHSIPFQIRAAFALMVAFILAPSLPLTAIPPELGLSSITGIAAGEILSGALLGLAASCIFGGFQFAGQIISFQLGFSLINQIDPQTNVEAPVFSFIQNYIGLLFFLLINGHHWFLLAINDSFGALPVGGMRIQGPVIEWLLYLSAQLFVIGLRIAGPVIAVTIITDVVLGIIGRAAPQIHIIIVGLPLKALVGFSCLSFSFYFLPRYLESIYSMLFRSLFSLVKAMS
ncbi:MAG: flagellar biosynthetic protein FliR [Acidobacteria bacterium]|nr:flagellar biosynthetic protein FliR [Acidobacteriota bacterium]